MAEGNPYAGMTSEEFKKVNWKELPLDRLRMFEAAVISMKVEKQGEDLPELWLAVIRRLAELEVRASIFA